MNKVEEIFKSWGITFNPNEEQSELASKRIEICNSCEHKTKSLVNKCDLCGCLLRGKVFSPVKGACPAGKWDEVDNVHKTYTKLKNLRFVSAQPATIYYVWQVEVMLNNFMEMGVNLNNVDIVCWKQNTDIPEEWSKLANNYPARFFFYDDTRISKNYISSIRPNILKQHWKAHPYLMGETIFYHDCDIVFTKPITEWITSEMINDDKWYGSDTRWYIGYEYIKSKGEDVLDLMCDIVGIDKKVVEKNEMNSIGAQYIMKDISYYFWDRVEKESEILYHDVSKLNDEKIIADRNTVPPNTERTPYHPLQIWCADMWAVLWNGWKLGKETVLHKNLNFSWATSGSDEYVNHNILHNAGVTNSTSGYFYKALYKDKLPYNDNPTVRENTGSWHYWQWVKKAGEKSVLL